MTRKEMIIAQAIDHKSRGIYDNAICKSGMERIVYATTWESHK